MSVSEVAGNIPRCKTGEGRKHSMEQQHKQPSVVVSDVGIQLRLDRNYTRSIKDGFFRFAEGRKSSGTKGFWALRNISFSLFPGDRMAILGVNGSGKSTLLKIIANVFEPTEGHVETRGRLVPLLELGAGFCPYYNAIENIFLYGTILGYSHDFLARQVDDIIRFAELEDFADVPIRNYSSGMRSRLGFAICTTVKPDILILDEVLAVGDAKFREKSEAHLLNMMREETTVMFVSHSLGQVKRICNRGIILEKGKAVAYGEINEIAALYEQMLGLKRRGSGDAS